MPSLSGQIARRAARWIPPGLARNIAGPAAVFFHGVEPDTRDARLQHNHHEADDFRAIAHTLKRDFDVLPLAALSDVLKAPDRHPRALFLMSDDGYANTLTVAAHILEEMRLPWTLFVSTHHIDTGERNPIFLIRLFIYHAPAGTYAVPHFPQPLTLGADREATAEAAIWHLRGKDMAKAQEAVDWMTRQFDMTPLLERFASDAFLTWDQVRELKRRGVRCFRTRAELCVDRLRALSVGDDDDLSWRVETRDHQRPQVAVRDFTRGVPRRFTSDNRER